MAGTDGLEVRPLRTDDAEAVADLWLACTAEVARNEPIYTPGLGREDLARLLRDDLSAGRRLGWLSEDGKALAGYVTCRVEQEGPVFVRRQYVYVIDLDVAAVFRGRGVSRLLMGEVERYARAAGMTRLELAYAARDDRAKAVWERHGFIPHLVHAHKDL